MFGKTASRPTPRTAHSHSHSHSNSQAKRSHSKTTTPADQPPTRVSASVGQSQPPVLPSFLRTPAIQEEGARTPSPNYFGMIPNPASDPKDSTAGMQRNWSPPTSSIQSFGAGTPQHLPLDSNPEFALFRRQTEEGTSFSLGHGNLSHFASTPGAHSVTRERKPASRTNTLHDPPSPKSRPSARSHVSERMNLDGEGDVVSPRQSGGEPSFFDIPRQQSPVSITTNPPPMARNFPSKLDDRHPRLSLPQNKLDPPSPRLNQRGQAQQRADTLPPSFEEGPALIPPSQLRDLLVTLLPTEILLLDLRVYPQFSTSRIKDALNLCIPTTLLKRPSFNLKKLQETFASEAEKTKFSQWLNTKCIVVYDAFSDEKKDAVSAINTLKKFTNEGWEGQSYIVRGGFQAFAKEFPKLVDTRSGHDLQSSKISLSLGTGPEVAPVAGGCAMPATKNAANPFFSNIRQNQDLIGGVGQMDVKVPDALSSEAEHILPSWLLQASAKDDRGKEVADKFLKLEQAEQARMQQALASGVTYGTPKAGVKDVQIAGIEKGSKNRYNNIWPFEHARVKLQGRDGACDYVNASHVKSTRSNKRYIASQGPLPATFEDFWSVIWDHDVRVVVMLTAESEGGQLKCHSYWGSKEFGPLKLKALSEKRVSLDTTKHRSNSKDKGDSGRRRANTSGDKFAPQLSTTSSDVPHAVVRKFSLAHASHPFSPMREITQIHYSSWPDFGAPADPAQLLGLVELSNSVSRASLAPTQSTRSADPESIENSRPVLVHCSAGCGRTGTFCTIDSVIDMLKRQRKEIRSGVTPMEGMTSSSSDYMSQGKGNDEASGDWVFDQDTDLVQKTVEDFREQRLSMVQSLRQYVLCYETVLEWIAQQRFGAKPPPKERLSS